MSIVRVGLSETQKFAEGWDAIFGKKKNVASKKAGSSASRKTKGRAAKRKSGKKK